MLTPQVKAKKLAKIIGFNADLYLKREDLHPYGSHKGRSIPAMICNYEKQGFTNFCISSSGNAALAAIFTIKNLNKKRKNKLSLNIFLGEKIDKNKFKLINKAAGKTKEITINQVENPKQTAFQMDRGGLAKNLRQSTDDSALNGYESLAKELSKIKNLSAIFIPTSSGTTAQGLHMAFAKLNQVPQIHIVQTEACHPIADVVTSASGIVADANSSIASAIVDKIGHRKSEVADAVESSSGYAWIVSDDEIREAIKIIKKTEGINASPNSALSVAAFSNAIKNSWQFNGPVVCLLTGR